MTPRAIPGVLLCAAGLTVAVAAQQASTTLHVAGPARSPIDTSSPAACVASIRSYVDQQLAAAKQAPVSAAAARQIDTARVAFSKDCASRFDVETVGADQLGSLATLALDAGNLTQATAAVDRALPLKTMAPPDRAALLVTALAVIRRAPTAAPGRDGRQQEIYPRLEAIVSELDASPAATPDQKFSAHRSMLGFYRGDDLDAGIIRHATWLLDAAQHLTPAQRQTHGASLTSPYVDMSESWAGQGMTAEALDLLRTGKRTLAGLPRVDEFFDPEIARLELVGTPAPAVTAPRWLNAPGDLRELALTGAVTLLEFTAHWCGPCRESYPGITRLRERFKSDAFRVVMVTRYYGYYSANGVLERPLAADVELERDRAYFQTYHLDVPVAIGDQITPKIVGGELQWDPHPDPNDTNYHVTGIPQIQIIDAKGVIRRILVGYDNANESALGDFIAGLLREARAASTSPGRPMP